MNKGDILYFHSEPVVSSIPASYAYAIYKSTNEILKKVDWVGDGAGFTCKMNLTLKLVGCIYGGEEIQAELALTEFKSTDIEIVDESESSFMSRAFKFFGRFTATGVRDGVND